MSGKGKGGIHLAEMVLAGPEKPAEAEPDGDREDAFDDFENVSLSKADRMDALALFMELS